MRVNEITFAGNMIACFYKTKTKWLKFKVD